MCAMDLRRECEKKIFEITTLKECDELFLRRKNSYCKKEKANVLKKKSFFSIFILGSDITWFVNGILEYPFD